MHVSKHSFSVKAEQAVSLARAASVVDIDSPFGPKTRYASRACAFGAVVVVATLLQSSIVSFVLFSLLILWDDRFIIPSILITPAIETILVLSDGITVTKLLMGLVMVCLLRYLYRCRKQRILDLSPESLLLVGFMGIVFVGALKGTFPRETYEFVDRAPHHSSEMTRALLWNSEVVFPKIIIAFCIYWFLKMKGYSFFVDSLRLSAPSIAWALIAVTGYFTMAGSSESLSYGVRRMSFEGADPNEFSAIISALSAFAVYLVFARQSTGATILGLSAIGSALVAICATVSRGGILSFVVSCCVCFVSFAGRDFLKTVRGGILIAVVLAITTGAEILNWSGIWERFFQQQDYSGHYVSATGGRWELFGAACAAFLEQPFLGHGNSPYTSMIAVAEHIHQYAVIHNLYLEILVRFGIVGFIFLSAILWRALRSFLLFFRAAPCVRLDAVIIIPTIGLAVVLFAGMALSWEWREILWYFIGIGLVSSHFCQEHLLCLAYGSHCMRPHQPIIAEEGDGSC